MLYLGITGTLIQAIDLYALMSHTPDTDPVVQSINAGRYGNADFRVLTSTDLHATALPVNLDFNLALATVLKALRQHAPAAQPSYVELRMASAGPVGQIHAGSQLLAFDASSGAAAPVIAPGSTQVPRSVREYTARLHRFWSDHPGPGVWVELLCGLALWVLLIGGLIRFLQLLDERWEQERYALFWRSPGHWQQWHRWLSLGAAAFLLAIAFSGTWLGFEGVWRTFAPRAAPPAAASLSDYDVQEMTKITLLGLHVTDPGVPIKVMRLRMYGTMKQGVVITGGEHTDQRVFNAETGLPAGLSDPSYPQDSGYPLGPQFHESIRRFHSGDLFGLAARWVDLLTGLALLYLCVSGLVLYRTSAPVAKGQ